MRENNTKKKIISSLAILALGISIAPIFAHSTKDKPTSPIVVRNLTDEEIKNNIKFEIEQTPNDTYYSTQKNYSMNNVGNIETVWDSYTGKGTKIAIIDTGIDYNHEDFTDSSGVNHIDAGSRYYYLSGTSVVYQTPNSSWSNMLPNKDANGEYIYHGINVAGTAAAAINGKGTVGIAPNATILALKCDLLLNSIAEAIKYAISQNVDVINLSVTAYAESFTTSSGKVITGKSSTETYLDSVLKKAYDNNVIVVAAAGNENVSYHAYPASNNYVIGVGALAKNSSTTRASFSNYNKSTDTADNDHNVDVSAPGYVYVPTTTISGKGYTSTQGTSFSSPIVAGAACLWKEKYPSGTPEQFYESLKNTVNDIGDAGWDNTFGYGALNIGELMNYTTSVTGVELSHEGTASILSNQTLQLTANVLPKYATNKAVTWNSSNEQVATVSATGLVTPIGEGTTTITVTTADGGFTDSVNVSVSQYVDSKFTYTVGKTTLSVGDTTKVNVTFINNSPSDDTILFESENNDVATIDDNGVITAVGEGSSKITICTNDDEQSFDINVVSTPYEWVLCESTGELIAGEKYAFVHRGSGNVCSSLSGSYLSSVVISEPTYSATNTVITSQEFPKDAISFTLEKNDTNYSFVFSDGKYLYADNTSFYNVSNSSNGKNFNITFDTNKYVSIKGVSPSSSVYYNVGSPRFKPYTSAQGSFSLFRKVSIGDRTLSSISVSKYTSSYFVNDTFSFDGEVTALFSDGSEKVVTPTSVSTPDLSTAGEKTITITYECDYGSASTTYTINVIAIAATSISTSGQTTNYIVGDTFSYDGTCTATMNNGTTQIVTPIVDSSLVNMSEAGNYTVKLTYNGLETSYTITVSEPSSTTDLTILFNNNNTTYCDNENRNWTFSNTSNLVTGTYLGIKSSSSVLSYDKAIVVDFTKDFTITAKIRTYGGANSQTINFTAYNSSGATISEKLSLTATSSTLNSFSGKLSFLDTTDNEIYIKATASNVSTSKYLGLSEIGISYAKGNALPKVTDFSLDKTRMNLDLYNNKTGQITANITADEGADTTITWSSSNENIATVENGTVTGVSVGEATITAKCGSFQKTCVVTVIDSTPVLVTEIILSNNNKNLVKDSSFELSATINPSNATNKEIVWTTSSNAIASISSESGSSITVTAKGNVGQTATITATANDGSDVKATCIVTIIDAVVLTRVELSPSSTSIPYMSEFNSEIFTLTAYYSGGSNAIVTPTSTNYDIDTSKLGVQTVSATYEDKIAYASIFVTNQGAEGNVGESTLVEQIEGYTFVSTSSTALSFSESGNIAQWTANSTPGFESSNSNRGLQWSSGSKPTITSSGYRDKQIKSISVVASANSASAFSISVGSENTSFDVSNGTINGTFTKDYSSPYPSGEIVISVTKSTKSFYIKSISVTYISGVSSLATPEQQAIAWAQYFLDVTGPICSGDGSTRKEALLAQWTTLSNEYGYMISLSKDAFYNNSNNNEIIQEAKERYAVIINRYGLNEFITNGANQSLLIANNQSFKNNIESYVIAIALISMSFITLSNVIFRKNKMEGFDDGKKD